MATKKTKVELSAETSKYEKSMRNVQRVSKKTSQTISTAWKSASLAVMAATAAMAIGFKSAIDAASDLQEVQGKFDVVFAAHKEQAEDMAKILVDSYAMSSREAKQYMSSIQDLLVPMGMASDKALLMSGEVVKLSADLGSFNNLPTAKVMEDIQSALVGNYETMKKYGTILNETVVKQKALEMGLYSGKGMVDANTKAQIAFKLMLKDSAVAIGDQQRTMGSYANQMKQLGAKTEEIAAAIGDKLLPEVTAWINQLNIMIEKNPQVIDQIGEFAKNMLGLATAMGKVVGYGGEFTNVWVKSSQAMGLASSGIITWSQALNDGATAVDQFNKGLSIEELRLTELERIMARTKDWPGVYTQEAYQKAKQEAEALRIIIASRKTLAGLKAPSRLDQALADPNKYYGGSAPEAPLSTTPDKLQRTKEYYKELEGLAQDSRNFALEIEDEEIRMFRENLDYRLELQKQYYGSIEAAAQEARDFEEEIEDEKMRMAAETAAYQKELNAQRLSDIQSSISMMTQGFQTISEMGGKHSKEAFAMYKGFKIIETIIATRSAAIKAYESLVGIPLVGPYIAPAAAAAAVTFGMAQVAMIKEAQPPSYDEGGISRAAGIYQTGPIEEAHIPLKGGAVPVHLDGRRAGGINVTNNFVMNNPVFQDLETQQQTMALIADTIARNVAPGAVVQNYNDDGIVRQMTRSGL